jgi:hypothetical protein
MNRREMIIGASALGAALPAQGQFSTTGTTSLLHADPRPPEPIPEEKSKQYAICLQRGHRPTIAGYNPYEVSIGGMYVQPATLDRPESPYGQIGSTRWEECFYCKTRWRFVTTMEEENKP